MRTYEISGLWNPSIQDQSDQDDGFVNEYVSFPCNRPNCENYTPSESEVRELYTEVYKDLKLNSTISLPSADACLNTDQIIAATRYYYDQISPLQAQDTPPFELLQLLGFPLLYTAQFYIYGGQQAECWAYTVDVLYWLKQTRDFMHANAKIFANESTEGITDMQSYLEYTELGAYVAIKKGSDARGGDAIIGEIKEVLASCAGSGNQSKNDGNADISVNTDELSAELNNMIKTGPSGPVSAPVSAPVSSPAPPTNAELTQYTELETAAKSLRTRLETQTSEHSQLITVLAINADLPSARVKELLQELPLFQQKITQFNPVQKGSNLIELETVLHKLEANSGMHLVNTPTLELSEKLSEVKTTLNSSLNQLTAEKSELILNLESASALKQQLESELAKLQSVENVDLAVLASQLITVKSETVQLQSEIASLEHRRRGYDEKKASEIREEERKQLKLEQLQTELEALKRACAEKQRQVQSLLPRKAECEALYAAHQELSQALSSANARIAAANTAIARFCAQDEKRIAACKSAFVSEQPESVKSVLRDA